MAWHTKLMSLAFVVGSLSMSVSVDAQTPGSPTYFAARTVYLHDPIDGFHQLTIAGQLGGAGTLILDPNTCTVNEFGDTSGCTRIAPTIARVTIKLTRTPDPAGLGRSLYSLEGSGLPNPLLLVVSPNTARPSRLIHNDRGPNAPRPVTLEPLVYAQGREIKSDAAADIEPCEGAYWAVRVASAVHLVAAGQHPTAGYQVFLEELPITVFPPEFRLVHIKPSGPAPTVITPFVVHATFSANETVDRVIVHDAKGQHEVPVQTLP